MDISVHDFQRILLDEIPLIDVRAPVEFHNGAAPGAVNLPLMNDDERHRVGTCYRKQGRDEAVALGTRLVSGRKKTERVRAWADYLASHPDAVFYCARGGLRSEIARRWLREETGTTAARIEGGYKALRRYLVGRLDPACVSSRVMILGGRTGTGKTQLLRKLENAVDLEDIAHHRGSSFGRYLDPQPSQADFENRLAAALVGHGHRGHAALVLEDEGNHIGKRYLPRTLAQFFAAGSLVQLEAPLEQRIRITFEEYVTGGQEAFAGRFGLEAGMVRWLEEMGRSVDRIAKRLGSERLLRVKRLQQEGHRHQLGTGSPDGHLSWIELLLVEYYDPMYDYQLQKKSRSIVFKGEAAAVLAYLQGLG